MYSLFDDGTDSIEYISSGCEHLWELTASELESDPSPLWEMIHPEDVDGMRESVIHSAKTMQDWKHEWRIRPRSQKEKWLRGVGSPIKIPGGVQWNTHVLDVTSEILSREAYQSSLRNPACLQGLNMS